jgi:amidase
MSTTVAAFNVLETTIDDIHSAYKSGQLTARQLVQTYLDRIDAYNKQGPAINAIITLNPNALEEADRLDQSFKTGGFIGPLHGIPVIIKDQADAQGMPRRLCG